MFESGVLDILSNGVDVVVNIVVTDVDVIVRLKVTDPVDCLRVDYQTFQPMQESLVLQ